MIIENENELAKKIREKTLVDSFIHSCPAFGGFMFQDFEENPDLVYVNHAGNLGFESVIITQNQDTADWLFGDKVMVSGKHLSPTEHIGQVQTFFLDKLADHLRRYKIPTVIVFSVYAIAPATKIEEIFAGIKLPRRDDLNIIGYYAFDGVDFLNLTEE